MARRRFQFLAPLVAIGVLALVVSVTVLSSRESHQQNEQENKLRPFSVDGLTLEAPVDIEREYEKRDDEFGSYTINSYKGLSRTFRVLVAVIRHPEGPQDWSVLLPRFFDRLVRHYHYEFSKYSVEKTTIRNYPVSRIDCKVTFNKDITHTGHSATFPMHAVGINGPSRYWVVIVVELEPSDRSAEGARHIFESISIRGADGGAGLASVAGLATIPPSPLEYPLP